MPKRTLQDWANRGMEKKASALNSLVMWSLMDKNSPYHNTFAPGKDDAPWDKRKKLRLVTDLLSRGGGNGNGGMFGSGLRWPNGWYPGSRGGLYGGPMHPLIWYAMGQQMQPGATGSFGNTLGQMLMMNALMRGGYGYGGYGYGGDGSSPLTNLLMQMWMWKQLSNGQSQSDSSSSDALSRLIEMSYRQTKPADSASSTTPTQPASTSPTTPATPAAQPTSGTPAGKPTTPTPTTPNPTGTPTGTAPKPTTPAPVAGQPTPKPTVPSTGQPTPARPGTSATSGQPLGPGSPFTSTPDGKIGFTNSGPNPRENFKNLTGTTGETSPILAPPTNIANAQMSMRGVTGGTRGITSGTNSNRGFTGTGTKSLGKGTTPVATTTPAKKPIR